jgi:outer membrane protein TolC
MRLGCGVRLAALLLLLCNGAWAAETNSDNSSDNSSDNADNNSVTGTESLTLEQALALAEAEHPRLRLAGSKIEQAHAERQRASARYGLESRLQGRLRWIDPPGMALDPSRDDHALNLFLDRRLYDFGRTAAEAAAAEAELAGAGHRYRDTFNRHRLEIMAAYFDVLLADLAAARDEEAMSIVFILANRAQQRNELGQLADIELMETRSRYQEARLSFYRNRARQRTARASLADLLNRPGQLPVELSLPALVGNERPVPEDVEPWLQEAESTNPQLLALQTGVSRGQERLIAVRAGDNPVLTGHVEVSRYTRESPTNDNWRAGVSLEVPLTTGGRVKAERQRYRAELNTARAQLDQRRREIRQAVLETWSELQILHAARDRDLAETDFHDLYLDRSRALYDLEVQSDLSDAMVRTSDVRLQHLQTEFAIALAWARIEVLLGRTVAGRRYACQKGASSC